MKIEFCEKQKFTQWWVWLLLTVIGINELIALYDFFFAEKGGGAGYRSERHVIISAAIIFGVIIFIGVIRLSTRINEKGIQIHFFPFFRKNLSWDEVKKARVINYGFVGGWGIRWLTRYGTVYNIRGNKGLALELHNGKQLVIGTQKEAELKQTVNQVVGSRESRVSATVTTIK